MDDDVFDYGDEDGVVASVFGGVESTFEIGQRAVEHGSSVGCADEARSGFGFGVLVGTVGAGVVLGDGALIFAEDVDAEAFFGMQMGVSAGVVIDADQDQQRVERDRGEGVGRHAVDLALEVYGDDRHPGGEGAHGAAEVGSGQDHFELMMVDSLIENGA